MAFTAADVKNLREMTGVGMMDCKKALTAADGDKDKAIEWLREKGLAAQTKKAGKVAAEGVSYAILIMNCCAWMFDKHTQRRQFGVSREDVKAKKAAAKAAKKEAKEAAANG